MFHCAGQSKLIKKKILGFLMYLYNKLCDEPRGDQCICDSGGISWPQTRWFIERCIVGRCKYQPQHV